MLEKGSDQVHLLFFHGHELLLLLLIVVEMLLIVVVHMFIHGLHQGVHADDPIDRLFIWFWGWDGRTRCRQRSFW